MHADEVETDVALVSHLVAGEFPHWAELPIEAVTERGTDNALFRLGDELVARLPIRPQCEETLDKEARWLPKLGPVLPLAVPMPVATGEPTADYPFRWAVFRWLDGETAIREPITNLHQAAADLAAFLRELHAIDPRGGPAPGPHNAYRGLPLAERDEATRRAIAQLAASVDTQAATALWEAALEAPHWEGPPVWIHGDLDARNLLVTSGHISAVIDFGCLGVGEPTDDVMVAWKLFDEETRGTFRTSLGVDDATWERSRGLALSQALNALTYYTAETNPVLVREAERWLIELLPT